MAHLETAPSIVDGRRSVFDLDALFGLGFAAKFVRFRPSSNVSFSWARKGHVPIAVKGPSLIGLNRAATNHFYVMIISRSPPIRIRHNLRETRHR
jgi:hypothetical protein